MLHFLIGPGINPHTIFNIRVYGLFSEVQKLEPKVNEKIIHDAMVDYIKQKYPKFVFYYTQAGKPLTDEIGPASA